MHRKPATLCTFLFQPMFLCSFFWSCGSQTLVVKVSPIIALTYKYTLKCSISFFFVSLAAGQLGPNGQLDSIELKFPEKAIPGSVGAVVYLTGNMYTAVILFNPNLDVVRINQPTNLLFPFTRVVKRPFSWHPIMVAVQSNLH